MLKLPPFRNLLLCLALGVAGAWLFHRGLALPYDLYPGYLDEHPDVARLFASKGIDRLLVTVATAHAAVGAWLLLAMAGGLLWRRRWTLSLVRGGCFAAYALLVLAVYAVNRATDALYTGSILPDRVATFHAAVRLLAPYGLILLVAAWLHLQMWVRRQLNLYTGETLTDPAPGDLALAHLRTHGDDPQYRKSIYGSVLSHAMVLLILPWLLQLIGCVEDYRVPLGSGNPAVAMVTMVQKQQKKKKLVLNPKSSIVFDQPDLDDSELLKKVQQVSELTYRADPNAQAGKMGRGGGTRGGWPDGMENAEVRFIRLRYRGSQWDDGMDGVSRADMNFLEEFHRLTGFKIRDYPEEHPITLLRKYRPGYAPPFVYLTGNGNIHVGQSEIDALREYLQDGGMLFADCGGPAFDRAFRGFIRRVFPDRELLVIANDDPIFQVPYQFPSGAPPLWHHGGMRAMGVKYKGRWCVFYHPGDVNDAWKTGHSGLARRQARAAFQLGTNIVYYSFTNYLELTREYRK